MVITFSTILLGLIALIRPLQRNRFFILNSALIVGAAYFIETHYFTASVFSYKTIMLFLVFQLISINVVTFIAYGVDKRAAVRGNWRVPEIQLHTLEFLGGWLGAYLAQRFFRHKISKKSYQAMYLLMIVMEFVAVWVILKFLHLL